ncbi:hypothetical protein M885DRAFT_573081 [Pelagophyceae sp. CCMP2097]|nr:hypothetical protein M885DRAFT_573081 [Pelagophyceae sp. CCMP2097]
MLLLLSRLALFRGVAGASLVLLEVKAGAATTELATSKHVVRLRCSKCASPVMARLGKNKAVLPLGLFLEPPPEWKPQHHLHYEDRIFDVDDGLPKWAGRFGQTACDARGDAVATGAAPAAAEPAVAAPAAGGEGKTAGKSKPPAAPTVMVPEPPAPPLEPAAADTTDSRLVAMPRHALTFLTDAQYAQWEAQGFLAIPNVVPADLCKKASDAIYDYVGADRGEPESWYRNVLDIYADKTADGNSPHHGPCGMAQLCHDDALWEIRPRPRQCPAMHEVFSDVYGTRRLYVTADRCHFKPPEDADHAAWSDAGAVHSGLHWDLDPSRLPVPFVVQGVVYLEDTPADRGALRVVPGSHRRANECRKLRDSDAAALDGDAVAISGGPGTLVLWHSGALHGPGRNVGATPRVSAYVAMLPVNARLFLGAAAPHDAALSLADAGTLAYDAGPVSRLSREARVKRWRDRLPLLDEDPRESDLARPPRGDAQAFAGLTPLGRRLVGTGVGLDDWPEDEPGH